MELSDAKKVLEQAKGKMHKAVEFLENELATYRVGKANPSIFSGVHIEYYGTPTPLAQVASISVCANVVGDRHGVVRFGINTTTADIALVLR